MKNFYIYNIALLFLIGFQPLFGQTVIKKAVEKALNGQRHSDQYYYVSLPERKCISLDEVKEYCKGTYKIKDERVKTVQRYGAAAQAVVSFKFRSLKEIEAEEEVRRIRDAEIAKARKKKLEEAKRKREEELSKMTKVNVKGPNGKLKTKYFQCQFEVIEETKLKKSYHLKVGASGMPHTVLSLYTNGDMYSTWLRDPNNPVTSWIVFDVYKAIYNEKACYYIHGYNKNHEEDLDLLLINETETGVELISLISQTQTSKPGYHQSVTEEDIKNLLNIFNLKKFYEDQVYPIYSSYGWSQKKVELSKNKYYIIDRHWTYSNNLSCYMKCHSCDFFGGKSGRDVEYKDIELFVDGKSISSAYIISVNACHSIHYGISYSLTYLGSSPYSSQKSAIEDFLD